MPAKPLAAGMLWLVLVTLTVPLRGPCCSLYLWCPSSVLCFELGFRGVTMPCVLLGPLHLLSSSSGFEEGREVVVLARDGELLWEGDVSPFFAAMCVKHPKKAHWFLAARKGVTSLPAPPPHTATASLPLPVLESEQGR